MFEKQNTNKNLQDKETINEIITNVAQAQLGIFQEMAKQQTAELSNILSIALKENSKAIAENAKKSAKHRSIFNFASIGQNDIEPVNNYNIGETESKYPTTEKKDAHSTIKEKKSTIAKYIKTAFERAPLEETETTSSSDWGFSTAEETQTQEVLPLSDDNMVTETNIDTESSSTSKESNEEWTWEYEEESADISGDEGTDWEWEYEEESAPSQVLAENNEELTQQENTTNENTEIEGEDWEWEYDDSVDLSGEEGADWEWEYDDSDTAGTQETDSDGWEWEYEEDTTATNLDNMVFNNNELDKVADESANILLADEVIPFQDHGEIVIAELRNQQNFADPYLCENISV